VDDEAVAAAAEIPGGAGGWVVASAPWTNCQEHAAVTDDPGGWPGPMPSATGSVLDPPTVELVAGTFSIAGNLHSNTS
jgi:hypothetical protein